VNDRKYRFRILNASNARIYNLVLTSGDQFTQIGTESGLLPAPVNRTEMRAAPAERMDVVVDFAGRRGETLYLRDTMSGKDLIQFRVSQQHVQDDSIVPSTLRALPDIGEPTVTRTFNFDRTNGRWTINGQIYDEPAPTPSPSWDHREVDLPQRDRNRPPRSPPRRRRAVPEPQRRPLLPIRDDEGDLVPGPG
jgi:FtsP/CotA-like multicopper oxidase with cupredoxin domain